MQTQARSVLGAFRTTKKGVSAPRGRQPRSPSRLADLVEAGVDCADLRTPRDTAARSVVRAMRAGEP